MKFGKKFLFSFLLGFDLLTNILELTRNNFLSMTTIVSFCTYLVLPGLLISLILRIRNLSLWEHLLIIVGLSIAFLEFGGLLLNILLPFFGINNPLALENMLVGFDIYILLLFLFAWIRTEPFFIHIPGGSHFIGGDGSLSNTVSGQFARLGFLDAHYKSSENVDALAPLQIQLPRHSTLEKGLYILPVLFPVLATLGAIILNNGGSNILTLILLGTIAFYSLLLVVVHDKISIDLYPYAIFFIGLASLFTTSLRSWYIAGHDIEREFYVFQLTNTHHIWNMAFYQDAYNACLSITILPTILSNLLSIQDMYVYKVVFQILFAISPVAVFFIIKNYMAPVLSFLAAFFFISFPTFFNDMPMLTRQEIGFIFFGLVLYIVLVSELSLSTRKMLFIIFASSTIISHYSTNFVLLALVTFLYFCTLITSLPIMKNPIALLTAKLHILKINNFSNQVFITLPLILLLFTATYLWNNLYTQSSSHSIDVVLKAINSVFVKSNNKSSDISYSLLFPPKLDPKKQLEEYIQNIRRNEETDDPADTNPFYSRSIVSKYPSYLTSQEVLAPTPLGKWLSSFISVFGLQSVLRSFSAALMQIFVFVGLIVILLLKSKKVFSLQYVFLCLGCISILIIQIVVPALSIEYGLLRMFQQLLFILSLPVVLGISSILFFMKERKRIIFTGIVAITFFLTLTGFISHLTGDYYPQMTLDNAGLYYDTYYVRQSDVLAITWLSKNGIHDASVQADLSATNKLLAYGNVSSSNGIFPAVVRKNAYVYQETSVPMEVIIDDTVMVFNSSKPFLDENKDLIYSNGKDNIYK